MICMEVKGLVARLKTGRRSHRDKDKAQPAPMFLYPGTAE
jgi:hypothetical protein